MKWGVRKARKVSNAYGRTAYNMQKSALKDLYKNGRITREAYKRGLKNVKQTKKVGDIYDRNYSKNLSKRLKADIKANPQKYKNRKVSEFERQALAIYDKERPGFAELYKSKNNRYAVENYRKNNYNLHYTQAELMSQKPGEAEQWKAIAKQIETEQKKKKR
jgi:hypothetical protein